MSVRPTDLAPRVLIDALVQVTRMDRDWITWRFARDDEVKHAIGPELPPEQRGYSIHLKPGIRLGPLWNIAGRPTATDLTEFKALGRWAADGPKTFVPTADQCEALEHVDVNLTLADYAQPFPALCVKLPPGRYDPFVCVLAHLDETGGPARMLSLSLFSKGNVHDIVTTVTDGHPIEHSLRRFDEDCGDVQHVAPLVQRVAINSCLLLAGDPNLRLHWAYPVERASDERLAAEDTERGRKARDRLALSPQTVSFSQEVLVRRTEGPRQECGTPTGREMPCHWRRGHWAMQPHGPHNSLRKRIFRPPVLVRADHFTGDLRDAGAVYRG